MNNIQEASIGISELSRRYRAGMVELIFVRIRSFGFVILCSFGDQKAYDIVLF